MSNSEQKIEQEIQDKGLNAPRLTPEHIDSVVVSEHYFTAADGASNADNNYDPLVGAPSQLYLLTFCVLVLKNGFTVTGESACASPENFDPEIVSEYRRLMFAMIVVHQRFLHRCRAYIHHVVKCIQLL